MKIVKYPDGTSYVKDTKHDNYVNRHDLGNMTFRINNYEDLWSLTQVVDAFNDSHGTNPNIIIPNLLDAQADRRFNKGESFGLGLVLRHLVKLNANFTFFHPHNAEVVEMAFFIAGKKCEIMDNTLYIGKVLRKLSEVGLSSVKWGQDLGKNLILMSPDAGAFKPMVKLANKLDWNGEIYSAVKSRDQKTHKLTQEIAREDFGGKDILIIDDLMVGGGTLKGLATMLRGKNVGKIYAAVSHITIQDLGKDPITNYVDHMFTTNSKFDWYSAENSAHPQPKNLRVFKTF